MCPNASHSSLEVCLLFIKRPQWVRESMNFRAGRDFKGDLVQPLHFINKEIEIQREGPCPRSDTWYVAELETKHQLKLFPPSTAASSLIRPDPCSLEIYNLIIPTFCSLRYLHSRNDGVEIYFWIQGETDEKTEIRRKVNTPNIYIFKIDLTLFIFYFVAKKMLRSFERDTYYNTIKQVRTVV